MADFANGFSTFMDTEKESDLWHKGIGRGIKAGFKVHDPRKVYKLLKISGQSVTDWYHSDGHYFDIPFLLVYGFTTALEAGLVTALGPELVSRL